MIFYEASPDPPEEAWNLFQQTRNKGSIIILVMVVVVINIYHVRNWILEIMTHKLRSFSSFNRTVHEQYTTSGDLESD